ncbi:MAG: putative serine/threonine-protein kinase, partial [Streblomastix strix]
MGGQFYFVGNDGLAKALFVQKIDWNLCKITMYIFEEIGRGPFSACFLGRRKQSIQFFCIKSIDKSIKDEIANETRLIQALDHPNIEKFSDWYETANHIWQIVELCAGKDLYALLQSDKNLPERSIHAFSSDVREALFYIHEQGIIYCDLRPKTILFDNIGTMKLCDFKHSIRTCEVKPEPVDVRLKLSDIKYLAPELLRPHQLMN